MTSPDVQAPRPLSRATQVLYASSGVTAAIVQRGLATFLLLFYNQVIGLPPKTVATSIMITLMIDAVIGPIIGQFSDNFRSKFGRRHPLMYFSAAPIAIAAYLLWNPPTFSEHGGYAIYLVATLLALRISQTCFELPAFALLPELTNDYNQRTAIISFRMLFGSASAALLMILAYEVLLKANPDGTGGVLARDGYATFGLVSAAIMFTCILTSALGTHSRIPYLRVLPPKRKITFLEGAREILATLNNRSFIALTGAGTFCFIALGARGGLEIYFNIYFWGLTQAQLAVLTTATIAASLLGTIVTPIYAKRFGKRVAVIGVLVASLLTATAPIALRLIDVLPANGTTALFVILVIDMMFSAMMSTIIGVLVSSMLADVVEDAEVKTGRRSEGLLFSAENLFWKMVSGVGVFISGLMLAVIAFPVHAERGQVSPETLRGLALVYVPTIIVIYIATIIFMWFYNIDRAAHEANLRKLAKTPPQGEPAGGEGPAPRFTAANIGEAVANPQKG